MIAPHPDDETFGCGGTLAVLGREGVPIHILFVTDGGGSHPKHPTLSRGDVANLRRREARLATAALGVDWSNVSFLDVPDGSLEHLGAEQSGTVVERISEQLRQIMPDTVLLPFRRDGSSEHEASFALVRRAIEMAGSSPRLLEFPVWSLWNPLLLLPAIFGSGRIWRVELDSVRAAKTSAIQAYASQTRALPPDTDPALPTGFESMFGGEEEYLFEHR